MKENRKCIRTKLRAAIKLIHPEIGELMLHTSDISDSGAYIFSEGNTLPAIGEEVTVQVQGLPGDEAPLVGMRIVRADKDGIGLEYLS